MDLLQLTYFCDAAERENFSRTAASFLVPTSSISQVIRRLEHELGTPLFDRHGNRVSLNPAGRILYDKARRALDELAEARRILSDREETLSGEVRLFVGCNRAQVARAIEACKRAHPGISFSLCHRDPAAPEHYDLLITDGLADDGAYERQLLVREQILLAAAKNYPFTGEVTCLADLREARFIAMQEGSSLRRLTTRLCEAAGFSPHIAIECDDPLYIRRYVEMGLGVALYPAISWAGLFRETVSCREIGPYMRETYVYYRRAGYLSRAARAFLACLQEAFPTEKKPVDA
ncbi:MAG: LysR family transcriptional regulator [Clostridia bacterium]|nr:LysR family transcriptional regulator [Clostridia bacterium]